MNEEFIQESTFYLAAAGYALLALAAIMASHKVHKKPFSLFVALVIGAHVLLIWSYRFHWDFDHAIVNGYAGFAIFHGALVASLLASITPPKLGRFLTVVAFLVVSVGANAAVWKYDYLAHLKIPVHATAVVALPWIASKLLGKSGKSGKKPKK
jgi:hypothetical protein